MIEFDPVQIKPCVGCGYCCKQAMCAMGVMVVKRIEKHCPLLMWDDLNHRYYCRMAIGNKAFAAAIHAGEGCCSQLNTWRNNVKRRNPNENE